MSTSFHIAKVTSKGQATIPRAIRKQLGIEPGDSVLYSVDGGSVTLHRAGNLDPGFLKLATESFTDWNSPEAEDAFGEL